MGDIDFVDLVENLVAPDPTDDTKMLMLAGYYNGWRSWGWIAVLGREPCGGRRPRAGLQAIGRRPQRSVTPALVAGYGSGRTCASFLFAGLVQGTTARGAILLIRRSRKRLTRRLKRRGGHSLFSKG